MNAAPDTPVVWVDGAFIAAPAETPAVVALDDGLLVGRGVFETLSIRRGVAFARRRHMHRLQSSAAIVGVAADIARIEHGIDAVMSRWGARNGRLRVTATAGGAVIIAASGVRPTDAVATVVVAPWPRNERSPLTAAKSTSYVDNVLAYEYARERGATEALFLNTRGEVCEGSRTNIFAVCDGRLLTPPLSAGCLAGVTRALVLDYGGAVEATLDLGQIMDASEAFLTSALRGAQPITKIDGITLGDGAQPQAARVARLLADLSADA